MPDGVIKWFDPKTGEAEVVRGGRAFPARRDDVEAAARHPGARVHFDIRRVHGVEEAVDVQLREGTRVSHHQKRFGNLAGSRHTNAKGLAAYAHVHPELDSAGTHPLEVARVWATAVAEGDIPGAIALCSPASVLHLGDESLIGPSAIHAWLADCPLLGSERHARIEGADGTAVISWEATAPGEPVLDVRCRIAHREIAEQWVSVPAPSDALAPEGPPRILNVSVSTQGDVGDEAKKSAQDEISRLVEKLDEPVLFTQVRLVWEPDPARTRRAEAEVRLDVDGDPVRARVAAHTMPEAIDLLINRLRDRLEHRGRRREHGHPTGAPPQPGEWRHGDLPTIRPAYFNRPVEDRQLVRHKTFAVDELTADEAVFDMEQLDYDFYLFCELASGSDSLIERLGDGSYRLTRIKPSGIDLGPIAAPVEVSEVPAPVLGLGEAIERLNTTGELRVFFADTVTGRGNVLYQRYDGHYGLVIPE